MAKYYEPRTYEVADSPTKQMGMHLGKLMAFTDVAEREINGPARHGGEARAQTYTALAQAHAIAAAACALSMHRLRT